MNVHFLFRTNVVPILFLGCFSCGSERSLEVLSESAQREDAVVTGQVSLQELSGYPIGLSAERMPLDDNERNSFRSRNSYNSLTMRLYFSAMYSGGGSSSTNWGTIQFYVADQLWDFAVQNNIGRVHGHPLAYHIGVSNEQLDYIRNTSTNDFEEKLRGHIYSILKRYQDRGIVNRSYDVINEVISDGQATYADTVFRKKYQTDEDFYQFVKRCFEWARAADPGAQLFYNDYGTEFDANKRAKVLALVNRLKGERLTVAGVSRSIIDGIGVQSHLSISNFDDGKFVEALRAFADTGLLVHLSELDVFINDSDTPYNADPSKGPLNTYDDTKRAKQKRIFRRVPELYWYSVTNPAQRHGITFWDLTDKDSWVPTNIRPRSRFDAATMYWNDGWEKPAFFAFANGLAGYDKFKE